MTRGLPFVHPGQQANTWSEMFASAWHQIYCKGQMNSSSTYTWN